MLVAKPTGPVRIAASRLGCQRLEAIGAVSVRSPSSTVRWMTSRTNALRDEFFSSRLFDKTRLELVRHAELDRFGFLHLVLTVLKVEKGSTHQRVRQRRWPHR